MTGKTGGLAARSEPKRLCRKCAVRSDPICAKLSLFNTLRKRFRARPGRGKQLISNGVDTVKGTLDQPTLNQ